jgi:peptidoglycan/LPS O-acetylase OafA/YrhL
MPRLNEVKIISIEYLRAFSMLYIVGYWHLFDYTTSFPEWKNSFTYVLSLIVMGLFVVISGFLVGGSGRKSNSPMHFYKTRLVRIYLLYALTVVLFYFYGFNGGATSIKSLFFVSMVYGPPPTTLWFINMLALFYLATPFLLRLAGNPVNYVLFIIAVLVTIWIFFTTTENVDERILLYFPCFCIGVYCSRYGLETRAVNIGSAFLLFAIGVFFSFTRIDSGTFNSLKYLFLIVSCSYLIFAISYINEDKFKNFKIVSLISYSSFAMYLFHRPIYVTLHALYFPEKGQLQLLYLITVCLPLMVFMSWGLQKLNDIGYGTVNKGN